MSSVVLVYIAACVEKTCVSGVFDKNLCKCVCPEGKYGELCSSKYDMFAASAVVITATRACSVRFRPLDYNFIETTTSVSTSTHL